MLRSLDLVWALHTNHARAIVLIVCFAQLALQACLDLRTDTNTISDFDGRHFVTNFDGFADDLMTDADWKRAVSPASGDGVHIRSAHSTALDFDVYVAIFEWLRFEL